MRKIITVWLLCLIAWNGAFGAFGGLLLCVHEGLNLHFDSESVDGGSCEDHLCGPSHAQAAISGVDACVDIELKGELLPPVRIDEQIDAVWTVVLPEGTVSTYLYPIIAFSYMASISARGPPELVANSVRVVRVIQLRV